MWRAVQFNLKPSLADNARATTHPIRYTDNARREFLREYEGRISCISITSPQGTFEVVIDQRSHLDSVEPSSMVSRSA
jgi:hypothetical protein